MEGKAIGYARRRPFGPPLDEHLGGLAGVGCWNTYIDRRSYRGRWRQLELAIMDCRPGDVFVVHSFFCFDDLEEYTNLLKQLGEAGASFRCLREKLDSAEVDLSEVARLLQVFQNAFRAAHSDATREGLAKARAAGRVGGRRRVLTEEQRLTAIDMRGRYPMSAIAEKLGVARSTLYNEGITASKKKAAP
jgi:DNA invertase Pin-like site-specific DNA recombinase